MGMGVSTNNEYYRGKGLAANVLATPPKSFSGMKPELDYIYEYSDTNFLHTRVKVLTGEYAGLILDYGGATVIRIGDENEFSFQHTFYEIPDVLFSMSEEKNLHFKDFLANLYCSVIEARKNDPDEKRKFTEARMKHDSLVGNIKIDAKFYNR